MKFTPRLLAAAGLLLAATVLQAQFVWTGSSTVNGSVLDANNWPLAGPGAPTGNGTETLQFGDVTGAQTNILVPNSAYASLVFLTGTVGRPLYTVSGLGGPATLTLGGNMVVQSGSNVIFDNTLGLSLTGGSHTFDVAPGTALQIDGNISGTGALVLNNSGAFVLTGSNSYTGGTTIDNGANVGLTGSINHAGANLLVGVTANSSSLLGLTAGAQVSDNLGRIGLTGPTTVGTVLVDGVGTAWHNGTYLYVGELGNGSLGITNGGVVTSPNTSIGNNTGGIGQVSVDGVGSALTNTGTVYVGAAGSGSLSITNGALVSDVAGVIANNPGGSGTVTIDGIGSLWNNTGDLSVGGSTSAFLSLSNGGVVNSANGYLALAPTAVGEVYLNNPGSTWNVSNALYIGYGGSGVFDLNNGAAVNVAGGNGTIYLGYNSGSLGQLIIGSEGGTGGPVNAATITTVSGTGSLDFQISSTDTYYLTKDGTAGGTPVVIAGPTMVSVDSGTIILGGNNTYTGGTNLLNGTLVAASNNALGTGGVTFNGPSATLNVASGVTVSNALNLINGGTLAGNGTIATPVTIGSSVVLAPGNSPGALNFSNGLSLANGGTLAFQVQQAGGVAGGGYDTVNVTGGTLDITAVSGGFTISLESLDGTGNPGLVGDFSASSGYLWTIFSASGGITGFSPADFNIDASNFTNSLGTGGFYVTQVGNSIELGFSPVPEPSTYALFASGLGVVGYVLRRRRVRRA